MESLKPLKIIGVIALLCLAIYLAFPNGRLNTAAYVRMVKNPYMGQGQNVVGPNAQLLQQLANKSVHLGVGQTDPYSKATQVVETALKSEDIRVIGFISRVTFSNLPTLERSYQPNSDEEKSQTKFLNALTQLNQKGRESDPQNAFFPLQLACISMARSNTAEANSLLADAAKCPDYNDFVQAEVDIRMEAAQSTPSRYEYYTGQSVVLFTHFVPYRNLMKGLISNDPPSENIQTRLHVTQIGIKLSNADYLLNQSVGRSYIKIAQESYAIQPGKASYLWKQTAQYSPEELEKAAEATGFKSDGLFIRADKAAQNEVDLAELQAGDWLMWINLSRGIITLVPYFLVSIPLIVAGIFLSSKWANKPWLKSIRYLAVVPLTVPFTTSGPLSHIQDSIALSVICASIPIALITFTERFVPVIHITVVAIAIYLFERDNLVAVAVLATLSSIVTLLAWYKNRNEETKASQVISTVLTLSYILGFVLISASHLINQNYSFNMFEYNSVNFFDTSTLVIFLIATLGIADSDKMRARFQATCVACIGLVFLIASCVLNLRSSSEIDRYWNSELAIVSRNRQKFLDDLNAPLPANIPTPPDVKKNR